MCSVASLMFLVMVVFCCASFPAKFKLTGFFCVEFLRLISRVTLLFRSPVAIARG